MAFPSILSFSALSASWLRNRLTFLIISSTLAHSHPTNFWNRYPSSNPYVNATMIIGSSRVGIFLLISLNLLKYALFDSHSCCRQTNIACTCWWNLRCCMKLLHNFFHNSSKLLILRGGKLASQVDQSKVPAKYRHHNFGSIGIVFIAPWKLDTWSAGSPVPSKVAPSVLWIPWG